MTPAQALWALWIAMTLGLAGCVSPSRETANTRCLEEIASSASYMSGGAPWDLATDPSDRSRGYVPGYRQRLEQDARYHRFSLVGGQLKFPCFADPDHPDDYRLRKLSGSSSSRLF